MTEFISWYSKFLRSVKTFKIERPKSEAFQSRTIIPNTYKLFYGIDGGCIYDINPPSNGTIKNVEKGTLEELVAKEEELRRLQKENEAICNREEEFKQLSQERVIIKDRLEGMLETLNQLNID